MSSPGIAPEGELVEEPPRQRSTIRLWAHLLAGPVLWSVHFGVVYFFSEAACAAREHPQRVPFIGEGVLVPVVVVSTLVLGALLAASTWAVWRVARRSEGDQAVMAWGGVLLGALFLYAIVAVGLPALGLDPC